jgi:hypothetical protein
MSVTVAQRQFFNPFPDFNKRRSGPDIWYGIAKHEKRENLQALIYSFLIGGGEINRIAAKKARGPGRHQSFACKGGRTSSAQYSRYFSGDNIGGGHRFTSKPEPVKDPKPSRDNAVVVKVGGKIKQRDEQPDDKLSITAEADLLSERAIQESAARDKKDGIKANYGATKTVDSGLENVSGKYDKATTRQVLPTWLEAA